MCQPLPTCASYQYSAAKVRYPPLVQCNHITAKGAILHGFALVPYQTAAQHTNLLPAITIPPAAFQHLAVSQKMSIFAVTYRPNASQSPQAPPLTRVETVFDEVPQGIARSVSGLMKYKIGGSARAVILLKCAGNRRKEQCIPCGGCRLACRKATACGENIDGFVLVTA